MTRTEKDSSQAGLHWLIKQGTEVNKQPSSNNFAISYEVSTPWDNTCLGSSDPAAVAVHRNADGETIWKPRNYHVLNPEEDGVRRPL